jgi:hypothetical protein
MYCLVCFIARTCCTVGYPETVEIRPGSSVAVKFGFRLIFIFSLSLMFGKNSLVMAGFVQLFQFLYHCCVTASFNSLCNVVVRILLRETAMSLFRVAALASWSANSFQ